MKKFLLMLYDTDNELNTLTVADPEKKLENGNFEIIKMLIGNYADEIYKHLTEVNCNE